jgi:glycosyltransferase involved in cell wall biosynthesis
MFSLIPIPSTEVGEDGQPKFYVFPNGQENFHFWADQEANGGVDPEFRLFLGAQLQSGDVLIDLAPGVGFLALTALTSGIDAIRVVTVSETLAGASALESNGRLAGGTIDALTWEHVEASGGLDGLSRSIRSESHVFIRSGPDALDRNVALLWSLFKQERVAALLIDPAVSGTSELVGHGVCRALAFVPHALAERDGELLLLPLKPGGPSQPMIAVPRVVSATTGAEVHDGPIDSETAHASLGFHFISPFCRTGYGIAGANLIHALDQVKADVAFHPLGVIDPAIVPVPSLRSMQDRAAALPDGSPSVRMSQQFDLLAQVGTGPRIGFPIFELDRFYVQELVHLKAQDRLLVCSDWARTVLRGNGLTEMPIDVVPLGVDRRIFHEDVPGGPPEDETVFIQIGKIEPRKGQLDLLAAFEKAFVPTDQVRLVLHCHNPFLKAADLEALVAPFRRSPMASRIDLHLEPLPTQRDVARAIQRAHCGVFCSRAEGWNLEALEVLSMGKPLIATDYSAHTEFLTPENAQLVEIDTLEPRGVGHWAAFGARQEESLITHLRTVHRQRSEGALTPNIAGIRTATFFSWEHAARCLLRAVAASV